MPPPNNPTPNTSALGWRSEEDYYLARLAVRLGFMGEHEIPAALAFQSQMLSAGQALGLGQILLREGRIPPMAAVQLQHELSRCFHTCGACGAGNWHAPAPEAREEACRGCGAALAVAAAGSSLSASQMDRRFSAVDHATARFRNEQPVLSMSGEGPRLFAAYLIEKELARGGMGAVYRVRHAQTNEAYALKVLLAGDKASKGQVHRFKREAKAQMELGDHPNVVKIHEAGEWEGILYAVMDLVEGTDLGATKAAMSRDERVSCMAKVARGVHYAHERGYIHPDLKPANILLDRDHQPQITDFGLTKNLEGTTQLTRDGATMGTPFYMAPEQAVGDTAKMGPPSDVYALGVILYELLTGEVPFRADSTLELYRMILELQPRPFAEHGVPEPELELIAFKAMDKDPQHRYPTALLFAEELERVLRGEKTVASQVSTAERMARTVEVHKRSLNVFIGGALISLVVIALVLTGTHFAVKHHREGVAQTARDQAASAAITLLERSVTEAGTLPKREALRGLDEALAAADEVVESGALTDEVPLREASALALAARVEAGLRWGAGREAEAGLGRLKRAEAMASDDETKERLALLRARCLQRVGRFDEARGVLESTSSPEAALALLKDQGLRSGQAKEALAALSKMRLRRSPERDLLEAQLSLRLGDLEAANTALQRAIKASARARLAWVAVLLDAERLEEAFEMALVFLREEPTHGGALRTLITLAQALGRDHEALLAVLAARRRQQERADLRAWELSLRARLAEDVSVAVKEAGAETEGSLARLRLDLQLARGEAPASLPASPALAAAVAAVSTAVDLPARVRDLVKDLPQDAPPHPELARTLRDLSAAHLLRGEHAAALAPAQAAYRALRDADSALLWLRAVAASTTAEEAPRKALKVHRARAERALLRELCGLQGPLSRGLALARWLRSHARLEKPRVARVTKRARELLWARRLGGCQVPHVARELAFLAQQAPPALDNTLRWSRLIGRTPERKIGFLSPKRYKEVEAEALKVSKFSRNDDVGALKAAKELLKESPYSGVATYVIGARTERRLGPPGIVSHQRRMRAFPHYALNVVLRTRYKWRRGFLGVNVNPDDVIRKYEKAVPDWTTPEEIAAADAVHAYLGALYPQDKKPPFPQLPRYQIRTRLGNAIRRDALYLPLLYAHAHVCALDELKPLVYRDLALIKLLLGAEQLNPHGLSVRYLDRVYRAWILATIDSTAGQHLAKLPDSANFDKDEVEVLNELIDYGSTLGNLNKHPAWKEFVRLVRR